MSLRIKCHVIYLVNNNYLHPILNPRTCSNNSISEIDSVATQPS